MSDTGIYTTRADLRRAFYRLTSTEAADPALREQGEDENEVAHVNITHGLWATQRYLVGLGYRDWITVSDALEFVADYFGNLSAPLPADFLRLAGDERDDAVLDGSGNAWGTLVSARDKRRAGRLSYWIEGARIHLGAGASPPDLVLEYHQRHAVLADDEAELDFPVDWRGMIPPEAAFAAMADAWLPGDAAMEAKIARARAYWRGEAVPWHRKTGEPQKLRVPDVRGTHNFF